MKRYWCSLFFMLGTLFVFAQEEVVNNVNAEENIAPVSLKDSILSLFDIHHKTEQLDSLWKQAFYADALFNDIYLSVTTYDVDQTVEYEELATDTLKKRLAHLNSKTPFAVAYNPILENVIKRYLKYNRKTVQSVLNLSQFYFPLFEAELDKHNLPLELKYLAVVESALNPRAKSRMGATGLWQFMYATGKMHDLHVTSYIDERSDPQKSTVAACEYLARLHTAFGDWDLALAAYNSGPGNVSKAMRRSGGHTNYWNLRRFLPRETAGYVPAFIATMYLFEYADEHGFKTTEETLYPFVTDTVHVKQTVAFDQLSELLQIDIEELRFLNPSYKNDLIPYIEGKNYALRLPVSHLGTFVSNDSLVYAYIKADRAQKEQPLPEFFKEDERVVYRVKSGDYLGKIASRYNVRVSHIKQWNGLRNNNLRIGQRLVLYPKGEIPATHTSKNTENTSTLKEYTVQSGDSLWSIAQKFPGVSVDNLKNWNDISGSKLKPGMKLKLQKG